MNLPFSVRLRWSGRPVRRRRRCCVGCVSSRPGSMGSCGMATAMLCLLVLLASHAAAGLSTVRVSPTGSSLATDATTALHTFALDEGGSAFDTNTSYALADTARFSRASWDCGAWGTQGAVVTQKILALGAPRHIALVRRWLLNTPVIGDTGEAFSTEGGQFHMGADGKWEANAELILSALLYAKHAGAQLASIGQPRSVFLSPVSRLVCAVFTDGTRNLLNTFAALPGGDRLCNSSIAIAGLETMSSTYYNPSAFGATMSAAYSADTEGRHQNASGVALFQEISIPADTGARGSKGLSAISLPLRQYKPLGYPCWPLRALVYRLGSASAIGGSREKQLIHSELIGNVTTTAWVDMTFSQPQPAGRYRVELWPAEGLGRADSIFTSAAWISTTNNVAAPADYGGSLTFSRSDDAESQANRSGVEVPLTLSARLAAAMRWQLRYATTTERAGRSGDGVGLSTSNHTVGIMTIPNANWRGIGTDSVGASSAMWDLIRSGYKDTWLNVRFLKSIEAMLELQDSGLVVEQTVTATDLATSKASFRRTFSRLSAPSTRPPSAALLQHRSTELGEYVSWIGCDRVAATNEGMVAACGSSDSVLSSTAELQDGLQPVSIGFMPSLAAAAALKLTSLERSLQLFDPVREAARDVAGRFRTNTLPIEAINVSLWRASSSWHQRDHLGFARRAPNSGGDWQIFAPGSGYEDGYGQWGKTEENGGIVLSTTALVFEAGPYPQMYRDFASLVEAITEMSNQLAQPDRSAEGPLLARNRSFLRIPIAAGSVVQELCKAARQLPNPSAPPDRWSERWCDYYKSVSYNLPGAGAFVFAFAKGLLQLDVPILDDSSGSRDASVIVWGTTVLAGGMQQRVVLPAWAIKRWPVELASGFTMDVVGLNVGGRPYTLECDTWCNSVGLKQQQRVPSHWGVSSNGSNELCCTLEAVV